MKVWIVWNEDMTEGIVLRDEEKVQDLKRGFYSDGLTEAFIDLYGADVITVDKVDLSPRI